MKFKISFLTLILFVSSWYGCIKEYDESENPIIGQKKETTIKIDSLATLKLSRTPKIAFTGYSSHPCGTTQACKHYMFNFTYEDEDGDIFSQPHGENVIEYSIYCPVGCEDSKSTIWSRRTLYHTGDGTTGTFAISVCSTSTPSLCIDGRVYEVTIYDKEKNASNVAIAKF